MVKSKPSVINIGELFGSLVKLVSKLIILIVSEEFMIQFRGTRSSCILKMVYELGRQN